MTPAALHVYKPVCVTPFQAVERVKEVFPQYAKSKIGYAGRLDPMAEGVLVLLIDDENKRRAFYEDLEKDYSFTVLFGISTDTYDVMGKIQKQCLSCGREASRNVYQVLSKFCGNFVQKYPPYSSAVYKGKPLYYWSRKGLLKERNLPSKNVTIHDISFQTSSVLSLGEAVGNICKRIQGVRGDFRQASILDDWKRLLEESSEKTSVVISSFSITCSSGTYVRSIAHEMGRFLQCPSLAYSITRTRVGGFSSENAVKLW